LRHCTTHGPEALVSSFTPRASEQAEQLTTRKDHSQCFIGMSA
jgi:hypothetical protein